MEDNVIAFPDRLRRVLPTMHWLMQDDTLVSEVLTIGDVVTDAHEREVLKRGAKFKHYGWMSSAIDIGSETTRGFLLTMANPKTGKIEHVWSYGQH